MHVRGQDPDQCMPYSQTSCLSHSNAMHGPTSTISSPPPMLQVRGKSERPGPGASLLAHRSKQPVPDPRPDSSRLHLKTGLISPITSVINPPRGLERLARWFAGSLRCPGRGDQALEPVATGASDQPKSHHESHEETSPWLPPRPSDRLHQPIASVVLRLAGWHLPCPTARTIGGRPRNRYHGLVNLRIRPRCQT